MIQKKNASATQPSRAVPEPAKDPKLSAQVAGLRYVSGQGPGILRRRRGRGFYYLGPDSKPIKDARTLERIRSLAIPPAWNDVWICPGENGHLQAVGRDAKGRRQYRYHPRYRQVRDQAKFERMVAFGAVLPKIRERVDYDLSLPGLTQRKIIAAIVHLLDRTCIRVGNDEYAKENNSYGLTTLRNRHAEVRGKDLRLHFRGKSKQSHDITLHDERLAKIVKQCQDLPGQELFQYKLPTGEYMKVDSSDVNDYLREIANDDFTAKDFRTWHGTCHMAHQLAVIGPAKSKTAMKRNIVEAVKETAKRLGNRPAACKKYYIHPVVFDRYMEHALLETMQNANSNGARTHRRLRPAEAAVLRLVRSYRGLRPAKAKAS